MQPTKNTHLNQGQLLRLSVYKDSFYHFLKAFWPVVETREFVDSPHIEYLCNEVQRVFGWVADWDTQKEG